jgi:N utilization substance protein B
MSTPRHRAREIALQILYRYDLAKQEDNSITPQDVLNELQTHFKHFQIDESLREFASLLAAGTITEVPKLDALIESHAANWKVSRMSSVDRCVLRMATYELSHVQDTDASVVIDEAIELGKSFGSSETPAFLNGILDAVKTSLNRTK